VQRSKQDINKDGSSDEDDEFYDGFMNDESEEDEEDGELDDEDMKQLMAAMDRELSKTNIGKSFERVPKAPRQGQHGDNDGDGSSDEDEEGEVDPQLNLVKNFLESYAAQEGTAGPVSNLLNELGRRAKK
jgi:hypothetical protein